MIKERSSNPEMCDLLGKGQKEAGMPKGADLTDEDAFAYNALRSIDSNLLGTNEGEIPGGVSDHLTKDGINRSSDSEAKYPVLESSIVVIEDDQTKIWVLQSCRTKTFVYVQLCIFQLYCDFKL